MKRKVDLAFAQAHEQKKAYDEMIGGADAEPTKRTSKGEHRRSAAVPRFTALPVAHVPGKKNADTKGIRGSPPLTPVVHHSAATSKSNAASTKDMGTGE